MLHKTPILGILGLVEGIETSAGRPVRVLECSTPQLRLGMATTIAGDALGHVERPPARKEGDNWRQNRLRGRAVGS